LLPSNRSRAETAYSAASLPEGQDIVRVWRPRDPAELRARLWPVAGTDDLWEASLRIRRLAEAMITIVAAARRAGDNPPSQLPDLRVWRGPQAPADLPGWPLDGRPLSGQGLRGQPLGGPGRHGTVEEHTLDSAALRAPRRVTVYRPPEPAGALPGCILADGQSAPGFAQVLEHAILAGTAPPVLLVGVHHGSSTPGDRSDRRAQEYLPGYNRRRFDAHLRFVTDEVIPWAGERFGPVSGTWAASGFSNGGAWAIGAGQRRPDLFGAVAAFSAGIVPKRISRDARLAGIRHYLAAGTLEPGFRRSTGWWADRLQRAGLPCRHEEWIGGHDQLWWEQQLPVALSWLLPAPTKLASFRSAGGGI
jgi:enterochelin esterase-like enzyme